MIAIFSASVGQLIPHSGDLPVYQLFLMWMAVPLLNIPRKLTVLVCTYLTPKPLLLRRVMYVPCFPVHQLLISKYVFIHLIRSSWPHDRKFYSLPAPNPTQRASGQLLWGTPITDMYLPRATHDSSHPLSPISQHHWSFSSNTSVT